MSAINVKEALERFEGDVDIYLELVDTFLEQGLADFGAVRSELAGGMVKQVAFRTHKIKGASLTIGAETLARIAGELESELRVRFPEETLSGAKAHGLAAGDYSGKVDALERAYGETIAELAAIRKDLRKLS